MDDFDHITKGRRWEPPKRNTRRPSNNQHARSERRNPGRARSPAVGGAALPIDAAAPGRSATSSGDEHAGEPNSIPPPAFSHLRPLASARAHLRRLTTTHRSSANAPVCRALASRRSPPTFYAGALAANDAIKDARARRCPTARRGSARRAVARGARADGPEIRGDWMSVSRPHPSASIAGTAAADRRMRRRKRTPSLALSRLSRRRFHTILARGICIGRNRFFHESLSGSNAQSNMTDLAGSHTVLRAALHGRRAHSSTEPCRN
jgi:hypothetical protein